MYGLVNKAIEDLVCARYGMDVWQRITARAGIDVPVFVSMDPYPDSVTYRLIGAASEILGVPADRLLEAFGEHWVIYTAAEGYGPFLRAAGNTLAEFLMNLDSLHARVALSMPQLCPPSFECTPVGETSYRLRYFSSREGLAPMVIGLLKGLGAMFGTPVRVEQTAKRNDAANYDEFLIEASVPGSEHAQ